MSSTTAGDLDKKTYTRQRLRNASPEHLYLTTRREFIGPIPTNWLKSNRRAWYKHHLQRNFSSKSVTFGGGLNDSILQRLDNGIEPSALATYERTFQQPQDVDDSPSLSENGESVPNITVDEASSRARPESAKDAQNGLGIDIPRSSAISAGKSSKQAATSAKSGLESFVTAQESVSGASHGSPANGYQNHRRSSSDNSRSSDGQTQELSKSQSKSDNDPLTPIDTTESIAPLLDSNKKSPVITPPKPKSALKIPKSDVNKDSTGTLEALNEVAESQATRLLRFDLPENQQKSEDVVKKLDKLKRRRTLRRGRTLGDGEIIKWEKMLVRIEYTTQQLPEAYDENESIKIETKMVEKWQEFIVVCREVDNEDAQLWLQFYQVRKIPEIEKMSTHKRSKHDVPLNHRSTHVNLFSALDKTVCIWRPWDRGFRIYIIRSQSAANSTEWYTFIRSSLGWTRSEILEVHVPDVGVTLQIENPFDKVEKARDAIRRSSQDTNIGLLKTMAAEQAVAQNVISTCLKKLMAFPEFESLVKQWTKSGCMGLAWKRFDRIEHIYGSNEQKMYGTIAMQRSHDLELRPKRHYPTHVRIDTIEMEEPIPVEGFLVRMSSTKGREAILGKSFSKPVYMSSHDQLLCSCPPAKAEVPPPSNLPQKVGEALPELSELSRSIDLIYQATPFDLEDGEIAWLKQGNYARKTAKDIQAFQEAERKINLIHNMDSYIDLCSVTDILPDVPETELQGGSASEDSLADEDRIFSLELSNGLTIKFKAFNKKTRTQWIKRLRDLVQYWQLRTKLDVEELKRIRKINLEKLHMDEQMESYVGQYAEKWEVMNAVASTLLYNVCNLSSCRTVAMSGMLYRKGTQRGTFFKQTAILCHGQLLLFNTYGRTMTSKMIPTIQYEKSTTQNLKDCYIYSGTVAEGDLLYQSQSFDPQHPGRHVLPRVYLQDDWTSSDEDSATCFVLWSAPKRTAFLRGGGKRARFKRVARLGVTGKSVVYMTRSRAERDLWVTAISVEIERMRQEEEEVDIV